MFSKSALVASLFLHSEGCLHGWFTSVVEDSWSYESPSILHMQSAEGIVSGIAGGCDSLQHSSVLDELRRCQRGNDILVEALPAGLHGQPAVKKCWRSFAATTAWQWACVEHRCGFLRVC
uniref:Secreted protein n=1 Tax=Rhipicephalus zambeziensis TaxID=60191 RepID=A0A224YIE9_9ACAR